MNLFWKKLFGRLTVTAKFEKQQNDLRRDFEHYLKVEKSIELEEYNALSHTIKSADFKEKKKTPQNHECKIQEQRYHELAKNPDIKFYAATDAKRFDSIRNWKLTFADDFDWNTLEKSRWSFGFHYKSDALLRNHSFANEQQANNSGKNVSVNQGILHIATKKEKVTASAWDSAKGFIEKEFHYTSDVIQSTVGFRQKYGVFQAKVRCSGKINHAFWLGADKKMPLIKIFHYNGKEIKVGNIDSAGKKETSITGLNPSSYYIYTLIWTEKEMIWLVNNLVVRRETVQIPNEAMYLAFNSFIPELQKPHEGLLEVDWVKAYSI